MLRALKLVWALAPRWNAASLAMVVLQSALPLAGLYALKLLVDAIAAAVRAGQPALFWSAVLPLLVIVAGLALLEAAARSLAGFIGQAQSQAVSDGIADRIHAQSAALDLEYYESPSYYDALHRAQQESPYRSASLVGNLVRLGQGALSLAAMLGLLFGLGWWAGALLFLAALPGIALKMRFSRKFFAWEREQSQRERQSWYHHWMLTDAGHAKEIRLFGLGPWLALRYRRLRRALRLGRLRIFSRRWLGDLAALTLSLAVIYGTLVLLASQAVRGAITLGSLVMYFQVLQRGGTFLQDIIASLAGLYEDNLFLSGLFEFLDLAPKIRAMPGAQPLSPARRETITFERVGFAYPASDRPVLSDIDLEIGPGRTIALVGANGSGKSTLLKLLCRLYDPTAGAIRTGQRDLRDIDPMYWRQGISALFQDHVRYNMTAAQNIAVSDHGRAYHEERIAAAARSAGAAAMIESLPQQYRTVLGHWFARGHDLSFGQWQKLALARALFRPAGLLLLDEPTSAMDAESESQVLASLRELLPGRTAVIVSHRLAVARLAQTICVLENGRIAEAGGHQELVQRGGIYARLFRQQSAALS
ncbi:MAG TPA: ABC transporter ATP-binding protein [Candidatus Edwardsbacteria bacterium]|nr:ABC transporter ATP-binding protein [Candidatus Edwardsbacteria bacterium]